MVWTEAYETLAAYDKHQEIMVASPARRFSGGFRTTSCASAAPVITA